MNNKSKRRLSLLLCGLLMSSLPACGDSSSGTAAGSASETGVPAEETKKTAEGEAADDLFISSLAAEDFSGSEFRIFTSNCINGMNVITTLNHAENETGEIVNDTLVARDRWLEETYDIKLKFTVDDTTPGGSIPGMLNKMVLAGDDEYDLIIEDLAQTAKGMAMAGTVYSMNEIPGVNLSADYWMPEINEQLKIGGSTYFPVSPISTWFYASVYIVMFNRDLAADLGIDDLYDLVLSGKWSIDKLMEYSRLGSADTDGDGQMTGKDRVGMFYEVLTPESLVMGGGYHYVENRGGELKIMLDDAGLQSYMEKLSGFFQEEGIFWEGSKGFSEDDSINNGTYLFFTPCTRSLARFRDLSYDYGVLPIPKKDDAQENYISYAQPWIVGIPVIPVTVSGEERMRLTGTITDAMAAYGCDYIRPAVYDNVIQLKGTRDEQSERIVDQLFDHVTFELASILKFGSFDDKINSYFTNKLGKQDIASLYASLKSPAEGEIEKIMNTFADLEQARKG